MNQAEKDLIASKLRGCERLRDKYRGELTGQNLQNNFALEQFYAGGAAALSELLYIDIPRKDFTNGQ